jgi:hypothetical protein
MGLMMNVDALQGADALMARPRSTHTLEAPANAPEPARASEEAAEEPAQAGVRVRHQANGSDGSHGSERPWRRVFRG